MWDFLGGAGAVDDLSRPQPLVQCTAPGNHSTTGVPGLLELGSWVTSYSWIRSLIVQTLTSLRSNPENSVSQIPSFMTHLGSISVNVLYYR